MSQIFSLEKQMNLLEIRPVAVISMPTFRHQFIYIFGTVTGKIQKMLEGINQCMHSIKSCLNLRDFRYSGSND